MGTAGRQKFNLDVNIWNRADPAIMRYVRVGKYDSKKMPAATLWRGDCNNLPQRYFYNDSKLYPGEYDINDIAHRTVRLSAAVDAVTLRPGYRVTLFSESGWRGEQETILGAYEEGREKEERLKCQKLKNKSALTRV